MPCNFFITVRLLLLLSLLCTSAGCGDRGGADSTPTKTKSNIRNVLLISIDTCRADHFGCYGYPGEITPHIDRIASQGYLFEQVVAPVPITLPSHSSMLTGTIPPYHGVHDNGDYRLAADNRTLAEILQEHGFVTGAIVSAFPLDSQFGLHQGFDTYEDRFEEKEQTRGSLNDRRGESTSRLATDWLTRHHGDPFFLFLHYFDPHGDYVPPEPFAARFPDEPYAGEVAYTDHCIGQVILKLRELDLYDSTLIIITSDHGEALGEHSEKTHAYFIYQSTVRVPLIVRVPGQQLPKRIPGLVGLIDIVPTVCSLLGIDVAAEVQGIDLSPRFASGGSPADDRPMYCECYHPATFGANPLLGVVTDRWKYIHTTRPELYDLREDPRELNDLITAQPEQARALDDHLRTILERSTRVRDSGGTLQLDDRARQRLESLGYVGGGAQQDFEFDPDREDPKDLLPLFESYLKAVWLQDNGQPEDAHQIFQDLLDERPNFARAHSMLATIAMEREAFAEAARHLTRVVDLWPSHARSHYRLGDALQKQGKINEALLRFRQARELDPESADTLVVLASILVGQGEYEEALIHFRRAVNVDPNDYKGRNNLAWILAAHPDPQLRDAAEAIELAERAVEVTRREDAEMLDTLAVAYAAAGQYQQAIAAAEEAIARCTDEGAVDQAGQIGQRLQLYNQERPFRDSGLPARRRDK